METIRNYLETMFSPLPNNADVLHAKDELYSMMEDKYNALIEDGLSESEAVAKVIAEFGNLDEIASDLGIEESVVQTKEVHRRSIGIDEANAFILEHDRASAILALSVGLFILSSAPFILLDGLNYILPMQAGLTDAIGGCIMFVLVAIGVGLIIISNGRMRKWNYLNDEPCELDYTALSEINARYKNDSATFTSMLAIGVVFCIISVIPPIVLDIFDNEFFENLSGALFMLFVAIGVMFILISAGRRRSYKKILGVNDNTTVGGNQFDSQKEGTKYNDPLITAVMSVYWETVICIYLSWSFLSFEWWRTWIVWPVAAIIKALINKLFGEEDK